MMINKNECQAAGLNPVEVATAFHVTPIENLPLILERGLEPQIGDRSVAMGEATRSVYLFPDLETCEDALTNWLGDCFEFEPENGLAILEIDVTGLTLESNAGFELACQETINPSRIVRVRDELGHEIAGAYQCPLVPMRMG